MMKNKVEIPTVTLSDGNKIPVIALGTERTSGHGVELIKAIKYAISIGYKYIDAAWISFIDGELETSIKEALMESNGALKREDLFLTCKLWNTHHAKDMVPVGLNDTLKNIGIDYCDLYYIHFPVAFRESPKEPYPKDEQGRIILSDVHYMETYHAMEDLVKNRKIKSIGLANFNLEQIQDVLKNCKIKPAVVQLEIHPYFQNSSIVDFCLNNGIAVVGYATLGAADLTESRTDIPKLLEDETIVKIAKKYNKSPAQVCIRWSIQRGCIPVVRALEPEQIAENISVFDFKLSDEDMKEIQKLDKNLRIFLHSDMNHSKYYPFGN